jgi:hypothetical protein
MGGGTPWPHVRGWLVTETIGGYLFDKHSVVGISDDLLDIIPRRDQYVRPFLIYQGTLEEFERPSVDDRILKLKS